VKRLLIDENVVRVRIVSPVLRGLSGRKAAQLPGSQPRLPRTPFEREQSVPFLQQPSRASDPPKIEFSKMIAVEVDGRGSARRVKFTP
jgi:hypothetical protein